RLSFFFQAEDGIRYPLVTGVQTCALPIFLDQGLGVIVDKTILRHQLLLKVTVGMNVNNHSQTLIENHLHRNVEISEVIRWYTIEIGRASCRERVTISQIDHN